MSAALPPDRPALILFAHGSRVTEANDSVRRVAEALAADGSCRVAAAFLELAEPDLAAAAGQLASEGVTRMVVIPYFLTLGIHLQRDLPQMVADVHRAYPGIRLDVTPPLDGHPALLAAVRDRAAAALEMAG